MKPLIAVLQLLPLVAQVDPAMAAIPDIQTAISDLIATAPLLAMMVYFYRALDERHRLLYDRYTVLNARYIRDVRAFAKLPADEFADDLNGLPREVP